MVGKVLQSWPTSLIDRGHSPGSLLHPLTVTCQLLNGVYLYLFIFVDVEGAGHVTSLFLTRVPTACPKISYSNRLHRIRWKLHAQ